jgi:hypothetical protein
VIVMIVLLKDAWNVRDPFGHVLLDLLARARAAVLLRVAVPSSFPS